MILNLKSFNKFLKFKHCKLESIENALDLIKEGCYFGSVDLEDAYYGIRIHKIYRKYLKSFWKEEYYQYIVLRNWFSPAVKVFTKVLTPPFKYLRSKGHLSVKYIDDSLLLEETWDFFKNIRATVTLVWELIFTIQPENSVLVPTQQIIFTEFVIDSVKMTTLTEKRKQSIHKVCKNILSNDQARIRELAQTIGGIETSFRAVRYGKMYYKELEKIQSTVAG